MDDLIELLDLEPVEGNGFRHESPDEQRHRVFGGQLAGQALVGAGRTVDTGSVHSLHRPLRPDRWFLYGRDTPSASGSGGPACGLPYQDGQLVVSVVQEGPVRHLRR